MWIQLILHLTLNSKEHRKPHDTKWLSLNLKEEDKRLHYRCKGGIHNLQIIICLKKQGNSMEKDKNISLESYQL